jgi:hypothetical protein
MTQSKLDYYNESGNYNPLGMFFYVSTSLITLLILAYIYSLIITFLPFIYLNFLIVIGFGLTISVVSRIFSLVFKIRNQKKTIIVTIILAFFSVYFQWVCYIFIVSYENFDFTYIFKDTWFFIEILIRPDLIISDIIEISKIGLWSIGSSDLFIRGFILWIIWFIEAVAIIFLAWNNFKNFNILPFSERDNNWYKKEIIDFDFEYIAFKRNFIDEFQSKGFDSIRDLKRGDGIRHSKVTLFTSETETKNIITIDNIMFTQRGKGKKDITNVLKLCYVDSLFTSQLRTGFRTKKASILDK